jgi:hypothetical protein
MIALPYSLIIEATEGPDYFGFYLSPSFAGMSYMSKNSFGKVCKEEG